MSSELDSGLLPRGGVNRWSLRRLWPYIAPVVVLPGAAAWLSHLAVQDFKKTRSQLAEATQELQAVDARRREMQLELRETASQLEEKKSELDQKKVEIEEISKKLQTAAVEIKQRDLEHTQLGETVIHLAGRTKAYSAWEEGYALSRNGNVSAAREKFNEALRIDDTFAPAYNSLGILSANERKWGEAVQLYLQAWKFRPGYDVVPPNLGLAYLQMQEFGESVRWCIRALETGRPSPTARVLEAKLEQKGLRCSSESDLREAFYQAGLQAQNSGKIEQAVRNYREGCEAGDGRCCMLGGQLLSDESSSMANATDAARFYGRACDLGVARGCALRRTP